MKKIIFLIICIFAFVSMPKALIEKGFEITNEKDSVCDKYSYNSIHKSKDGGFFILGSCKKKDEVAIKPFIEKRDKNGKLVWTGNNSNPNSAYYNWIEPYRYGSYDDMKFYGTMLESKDGNVYVTSSTREGDIYVLYFNAKTGVFIGATQIIRCIEICAYPSYEVFIENEKDEMFIGTGKLEKYKKETKNNKIILTKIKEKIYDSYIYYYYGNLSNGNMVLNHFIINDNLDIVKTVKHVNELFVGGYVSNDKIYGLYVTEDNKVILKELNSNLEEVNNINLSSLDSTMPRELLNFHDQGNIILNSKDDTLDSDFIVSYYINDKVHSGYKLDIKDIRYTQSIVLDSSNIVTLYQGEDGGEIIPKISGIINTKLIFQAKTEAEENGKVELSKTKAAYKDEISVNVKPNFGYKLKSIEVMSNSNNKIIPLKDNKFTMPADDVIIKVNYEKSGIINPKTGVYSIGIIVSILLVVSLISYIIINIKQKRTI